MIANLTDADMAEYEFMDDKSTEEYKDYVAQSNAQSYWEGRNEMEQMLDEFSRDYDNWEGGYLFLAEQSGRVEDDERDEVEELF